VSLAATQNKPHVEFDSPGLDVTSLDYRSESTLQAFLEPQKRFGTHEDRFPHHTSPSATDFPRKYYHLPGLEHPYFALPLFLPKEN